MINATMVNAGMVNTEYDRPAYIDVLIFQPTTVQCTLYFNPLQFNAHL